MSFTPFNAPLLSGILGDNELAVSFSVKADLAAMTEFETALAAAQAEVGLIPETAAHAISERLATFEADVRVLNLAAVKDGMTVPDLIRQMRIHVGEPHSDHLHFGSTSHDVIDTSLIMRLKQVNRVYRTRLTDLLILLERLKNDYGAQLFNARTRMQVALPVKLADRIDLWRVPLANALEDFDVVERRLMQVQCAGPVGTLDKYGDKGEAMRTSLARRLDLADPGRAWHTDRSTLLAYVNWLSQVAAVFGKLAQDLLFMAQNEVAEVTFEKVGGSSAMAHKQNPVKAEILVAQANFIATLAAGMHHAQVHEQERSGAMWTLEWMLIPQLCVATGAAMRNADLLLQSVTAMGKKIS